jgi:hypothetical protein
VTRAERQREYSRRWRENNPERAREVRRRYYDKHADKAKAASMKVSRRKRAADPDFHRRANLKRNYGLTLDAYAAMLSTQGGVCAICRSADPGCHPNFHVDHDHATGAIRALLCFECNRGLGAFKDSPSTLENAAAYLRRFGKV